MREMLRCASLVALVILSWAGAAVAQEVPAAPPPQPFDTWLADVRAEALTRGIRPEVLDAAFADVKPVEQILERDRTQAEFALDLTAYLKRRLTKRSVLTAQQMHAQYRDLLIAVGKKYEVQPRIITAVWGLES